MNVDKSDVTMNRIRLAGDLVFPDIDSIRKKAEASISAQDGDCEIDFSDIGRVDSSSLSLCLCLLRLAKMQGKQLIFINFPKEMVAIAELVGLQAIVSIS